MPDFQRIVIETDQALEDVCVEFQDQTLISVDSETSGLDPKRSKLALVQISSETLGKTYIVDYQQIKRPEPLRDLMLNPKIAKLCHTGNFDSEFFIANFDAYIENPIDLHQGAILLKEYGYPPGTPPELARGERTPKLMAYLEGDLCIDGTFSLQGLLRKFCDIWISKELQTSNWLHRPLTISQIEYSALDVEHLFALFPEIANRVEAHGMTDTWMIENALQMVTAQLRYYGIKPDLEEFQTLSRDIESKIGILEKSVSKFPEFREKQQDIFLAMEGEYSVIPLSSSKQVKEALEKRWKIPVKSVRAGELKKEASRDPELVEILTDRASLNSMNSNSVKGAIKYRDEITKRIHPDYQQNASPQHRPKSSKPIVHNIPNQSKYGPHVLNKELIMYSKHNFRDGFVPGKGCLLVKSDYAQLQLRALAQESGDPVMLKAFIEGLDLHTITGTFIFDLPEDTSKEVLGTARRHLAKTSNFAIGFLCSPQTLQRTFLKDLGVYKTEDECELFIKKYLQRYRGIAAYHRSQPNIVKRDQAIRVVGGRATLLMPGVDCSTEAINFVMAMLEQSGIKKALSRLGRKLWKISHKLGIIARIVLWPFDEIVVEIDARYAKVVASMVEKEMVRSMADYIYKVPVIAESAIVRSWGSDAIPEEELEKFNCVTPEEFLEQMKSDLKRERPLEEHEEEEETIADNLLELPVELPKTKNKRHILVDI